MGKPSIDCLREIAVCQKVSDVHLHNGKPPALRIDGRLCALDDHLWQLYNGGVCNAEECIERARNPFAFQAESQQSSSDRETMTTRRAAYPPHPPRGRSPRRPAYPSTQNRPNSAQQIYPIVSGTRPPRSIRMQPRANKRRPLDTALLAIQPLTVQFLKVGRLDLQEKLVKRLQIDIRKAAGVQPHPQV